MGTTTKYALRYPELVDAPNVQSDLKNLATDVDNAMAKGVPTGAVVNGQWIRGSGGVPVWSAITVADIAGLVSLTTGDIIWSVANSRVGAVLCDGSLLNSVSDTTLAALFALIGTTYGGTGAASFAVPDVRGRVLVCKGTNADVSVLGESDGLAVANRSPVHNSMNSLGFSGAAGNTGTVSTDHAHYTSGQTGGRSADHNHDNIGAVLGTPGGNYGSVAYGGLDTRGTGGENVDHSHSFGGWSGGISANHTHAFTPAGSITGSVGPGGSRPSDQPAYIVENCFLIK